MYSPECRRKALYFLGRRRKRCTLFGVLKKVSALSGARRMSVLFGSLKKRLYRLSGVWTKDLVLSGVFEKESLFSRVSKKVSVFFRVSKKAFVLSEI